MRIKREDVSTIRPKKLKPFDLKKFIDASEKLRRSVEKEEEDCGRFAGMAS